MRKVDLNRVQPGVILAKPIFRDDGNILLGAGMELSSRYIQRLLELGIDTIFIEDPLTEGIVPGETLRAETRRKATEAVHKLMTTQINQPSLRGRAALPELGRTFRSVFNEIMNDIMALDSVLVELGQMHSHDAYLFHHSVNVATLAGIIGLAKGFNRNQMEELGVGALLFDIGMTKVPKQLLQKNGPFTAAEKEIVQKHTQDGYDLLRKQHDLSLLSAHCALQHHERYNGSGYPRGIEKNDIHIYAQIVGIADAFDALTASRPFRKRYTPSEAIEFLFASGNTYFDLDLVRLFCSHISMYPVSTTVLLNTGQIAVVSKNHQVAVHRPTVRVIREADGSEPKTPYDIDMQKELHLTIIKEI